MELASFMKKKGTRASVEWHREGNREADSLANCVVNEFSPSRRLHVVPSRLQWIVRSSTTGGRQRRSSSPPKKGVVSIRRKKDVCLFLCTFIVVCDCTVLSGCLPTFAYLTSLHWPLFSFRSFLLLRHVPRSLGYACASCARSIWTEFTRSVFKMATGIRTERFSVRTSRAGCTL